MNCTYFENTTVLWQSPSALMGSNDILHMLFIRHRLHCLETLREPDSNHILHIGVNRHELHNSKDEQTLQQAQLEHGCEQAGGLGL